MLYGGQLVIAALHEKDENDSEDMVTGEEEAALPNKDKMSKEFKEITGNRAAMRGLHKQNYMKVSEIACHCALSIEKGCTRLIVHSGKSRVHPAPSIHHNPAQFKTSSIWTDCGH